LAFSSDRDGNRQIYVAGADGADPLRLTSDAAVDHQPSFSPDGSRIAFTIQRAGGVAHIYVMDARGSTPVLLTSSDTSADHNPSFSPDGTKIALAGDFVCPPDQGCGAILAGGIYVIPSDGSGGRTLVTAYAPLADTDWGVGTPAVPPPPPPEPADTTPPDTSITSGPSGATNNPTATFAFVATDDITPGEQLQYSYRLDGDAWSSYSTATTATLTLADSAHTFAVRARDEAGNQDPTPAQRSFTVDTAAPAGSLAIQGGAARTRTLNVTLTLGASDPAPSSSVNARRISNTSGGLADAAWRPYAATEEWTLSSGRGTKTVYAQYRDAAGNVSPAARDTITYKP
jgi:dipeptidyl aminopeptidase/acylaminoacyl peptidase